MFRLLGTGTSCGRPRVTGEGEEGSGWSAAGLLGAMASEWGWLPQDPLPQDPLPLIITVYE